MSYSGSEPVELLAFRARLCGITTESHTIQELSAQMRKPTDPGIQALVLRIWLADVRQAQDAPRLLALIYLANDVIQLLRGSEQSLEYRYNFGVAFAEAIVVVRQRAPFLVSKIARVIAIFRERLMYDTHILSLLQRVLQDDIQTVTSVISLIRSEICDPVKLTLHIQLLENDIKSKGQASLASSAPSLPSSSSSVQQYIPRHPQSSLVAAKSLPPPTLEDLLNAGGKLEKLRVTRRSQESVNLDAEVVSRIRGYRIPLSAQISVVDAQLINIFQALLKQDRECFQSIEEKITRRQKESDQSQFLLLPQRVTAPGNVIAAKKVEVLLKKEWNLRCDKLGIEHSIYWHMVEILDHFLERWSRVQCIATGVETETKRRTAEAKSSEVATHTLPWPNQ